MCIRLLEAVRKCRTPVHPRFQQLPQPPLLSQRGGEARDKKGMYPQARRGEIKNFTGIDDPYEPPLSAEVTIGTTAATPAENAAKIVELLRNRGWIV